eukprot:XP_011673363.1 PREDICTED: probable 2-oxoglutarate dehydrogenase E1 component DHKTD1, mitochondrial [Strongylocentrotus purpuratus]
MLRFLRHSRVRILSSQSTPRCQHAAPLVPAVQHLPSRLYNVGRDVYGYRQSAWRPLNLIGLQQQAEGINTDEAAIQNRIQNANLLRLVTAYREHGHKRATLDPLGLLQLQPVPELEPHLYGLSSDSSESYNLTGIVNIGKEKGTVQEVLDHLKKAYCSNIAVEFSHLLISGYRHFKLRVSNYTLGPEISAHQNKSVDGEVIHMLQPKVSCQTLILDDIVTFDMGWTVKAFDQFMTTKFATVKRYGGEGAESMMVFFHQLFTQAASDGVEDIILAMPHRGRLNLLMGPLGYSPMVMLKKLRGNPEFPPHLLCVGDIPTHLCK